MYRNLNISRRKFFSLLGASAFLALGSSSILMGCQQKKEKTHDFKSSEELVSGSTFAFDTLVNISAYAEEPFVEHILSLCHEYDALLAARKEGSDIQKINNAKGKRVEVEPCTAECIAEALAFCESSGGSFDITIGAASLLWDFTEGIIPKKETLEEAIQHIDYKNVEVEKNTVRLKDPHAKIDLGGFAKGWIADRLREEFISSNITGGVINLGGNVVAVGEKKDGSAWRIGINDPNHPGDNIIAFVEVKDKSVVTSGIYERNFTKDGVTYHHILDPKTGYPVDSDIVSDSIVSNLSGLGDATSTTLFLHGFDKATSEADQNSNYEAYILSSSGQEFISNNLSRYNFTLLDDSEDNQFDSRGQ